MVRLKGGDPSIFGRVGEEQAFLRARGVETEVVPGVTAASAAAAQFGFPLTHRGEARRLLISTVTAQDGALVGAGWAQAADPQTTVALYMGRDRLEAALHEIQDRGRAPDTPAIAVENAGRPDARALHGSLRGLGARVAEARFEGPVVLILGDVAAQAHSAKGVGADDDLEPISRQPAPTVSVRAGSGGAGSA